jgi:hypothetical protein
MTDDTLKSYFQILRCPKKLPTLAECPKTDSTYYACSVEDFEGILETSGFKFVQSENINNCSQKITYLDSKNDTLQAYFKLIRNSDDDGDCGARAERNDDDSQK